MLGVGGAQGLPTKLTDLGGWGCDFRVPTSPVPPHPPRLPGGDLAVLNDSLSCRPHQFKDSSLPSVSARVHRSFRGLWIQVLPAVPNASWVQVSEFLPAPSIHVPANSAPSQASNCLLKPINKEGDGAHAAPPAVSSALVSDVWDRGRQSRKQSPLRIPCA